MKCLRDTHKTNNKLYIVGVDANLPQLFKMNKILTIAAVLLVLTSCLKDKTQSLADCSVEISYALDIRPIIESSCKTQAGPNTGCHDAWIDEYPPIKSYINSGTWQNEVFNDKTMPEIPNTWGIDSLTTEEIQTMKCWIEQGYPEN